jgi:hypothetical protein
MNESQRAAIRRVVQNMQPEPVRSGRLLFPAQEFTMRDMTPQDKMLSVMGGRKPLALPEGTKKTDTAQPEGLFVDYYPERRAADVVNSQDFQPATIEAGLDPEEYITIYRGAPSSQKKINNGDWVTTSEQLAKDYAGNGVILKDRVKAKYLYAPTGEGVEELIYSTNKAEELKPLIFKTQIPPSHHR